MNPFNAQLSSEKSTDNLSSDILHGKAVQSLMQ